MLDKVGLPFFYVLHDTLQVADIVYCLAENMGWIGMLFLLVCFSVLWWKMRKCHAGEKKQWEERVAASVQKQRVLQAQLQETRAQLYASHSRLREMERKMVLWQEEMHGRKEQETPEGVALRQEEFEHLPVYVKIRRIVADYAHLGKSDEKMTEEDWLQWESAANRRWNKLCLKLRQYHLTPREIRLCCLVLVGIPVSHLVYLFDRQLPLLHSGYVSSRNQGHVFAGNGF